MKKKSSHQLPKGWTLAEVQKIAKHYDNQSDTDGAAEIDSAEPTETVVVVPHELLPRIRKMIAENHRRKARQPKSKRVA